MFGVMTLHMANAGPRDRWTTWYRPILHGRMQWMNLVLEKAWQGLSFHLIESGGWNFCVVASGQRGCPHPKAAQSSIVPIEILLKENTRGLLRPLVDAYKFLMHPFYGSLPSVGKHKLLGELKGKSGC